MSADATHGSRLAPRAPPARAGSTLRRGEQPAAAVLSHQLRLVVLVLARHAGRPRRRARETASGSDVSVGAPSGLNANICSYDPPEYIRAKAVELRTQRNLSIDEIAERLALSRTTVFYWLRDLPINRSSRPRSLAQLNGNLAMQEKYRRLREAAYAEGRASFDELAVDPSFRDFVCLYLAEGYKRHRNYVSVCNSDPTVVVLCNAWLCRLATGKLEYWVQYHADQDLDELRRFWGAQLDIRPEQVRMQRKSNSKQLAGRTWRSVHGVLTVRACDTLLRAKLQGGMDRLRESWL